MKKLQSGIVINVALMFILLILPLNLWAVEYPEDSASPANAQEEVVHQDEATKKIQEMIDAGEPNYKPVKSAEDLADKYLEDSGLFSGWNEESRMYVAIGVANFDSEDPSYDDSFIIKRSLKSMEATLDSKSQIIEYIQTEMSAMDKVETPGTDLNAEFNDKINKTQKIMEDKKERLAKMLELVDQAEAEALRGATFGDRMNAAMDAAIKKLDKEYSAENIDEKKRAKYEALKTKYNENRKEFDELKSKIEARV